MISKQEEYDNLFQNLIPNSIEGIKIFGVNDSYVKPQNYDSVTNLENRIWAELYQGCLLYTSPSPRDGLLSRMPSSA